MPVPEISGKRILFGVLNWGMGHASRSSVLIEMLTRNRNTVEIVSSGMAFAYLKKRFPELKIYDLEHAELVYPKHSQLWFALLMQRKKIFGSIQHENNWLKKHLTTNHADLVISDNCYGFYHKNVHSIFMTHQLHLKAPFFEGRLNTKIRSLIDPFNEIWIPDTAGDLNLAGELSHPPLADKNCTYIGTLSVLEKNNLPQRYAYCAVISGPEKQRSLFESSVIEFLKNKKKPAVVIRGVFSPDVSASTLNNIQIHDFLHGKELAHVINQSEVVICRSGYSSIMDLYTLEKPCLLLPTPGQTEQEYLCKKHMQQGIKTLENVEPVRISLCKG
ncbi:MAG TPA: glycosyltransferase family protein [Flavobacteriales bacterium]|nr:glycosyltransferase family protein [Flavobacteriales bacterium]